MDSLKEYVPGITGDSLQVFIGEFLKNLKKCQGKESGVNSTGTAERIYREFVKKWLLVDCGT